MIRTVSREPVNVETRCVAEQRGKSHRTSDKVRDDTGDVRIQIDKAFVHVPQQRHGKHGFADGRCLEQHVRVYREIHSESSAAGAEGFYTVAPGKRKTYSVSLFPFDFQ